MKTFLLILKSYVAMMAVFTVAIILAFCIPNAWLKDNVEDSIALIQSENEVLEDIPIYYHPDNFTNLMMLGIMMLADDSQPIDAAMHCYVCEYNTPENVMRITNGDTQWFEKSSYGRYWHGYNIILRPLLIVMPLGGITILNYVVFTLLLLYLCVTLWRFSRPFAIMFLATLALLGFPVVPLSMQLSPCFYIPFVGMLLLLKLQWPTSSYSHVLCFFFIIGGVTSFLDFLVTPLLTVGFPLLLYMAMVKHQHIGGDLKKVIFISLAWLGGYALLWSSKWVLGSLITGSDFFPMVMESISYRTAGNDYEGDEIPIFPVWVWEKLMKMGAINVAIMGVACVAFIVAYIKALKSPEALKRSLYLLLIAAMAPVWFTVLLNHSIVHLWFTWRTWGVTVLSIMLFVYYTTDYKKLLVWRK